MKETMNKPLTKSKLKAVRCKHCNSYIAPTPAFKSEDVASAVELLKEIIQYHNSKQCWEEHDCLFEIFKEVEEIFPAFKEDEK